MKYFLSTFLIFWGFHSFSQRKTLGNDVGSQRLRLKNYAFCSCILNLDTAKRQQLLEDGSKGGYFEISDYQLSAYQVIDTIAKRYALKKYSSYNHKSLGLMKCLDFYNSKELADKIKSLDKLLNK